MTRRTLDHPHVIVLCVDALRADCLTEPPAPASIWAELGPPRTPAMDAFAATARVHRTAVASSSWTRPCVPSMFLSLHPSEHGVLEVAKGRGSRASSPPLPESAPTLAETLRRAGYRTLGLGHNAQLDPAFGFDRGFDLFDSDAGDGPTILESLRVADPFREGRPVFLYLHLIEPHWPFHARIADRAEPHAQGRFAFHRFQASEWKALKHDLKTGEVSLRPDEVRFLRTSYGLAVEEVDRLVGQLLDWLEREGILDRAVVALTADHGEELLDHGLVGHGQSLHEELIRVPLMLRAGTSTPCGDLGTDTVRAPVSQVDLYPTLLEAVGIPFPGTLSGRSALDIERSARPVFSEVKHKRRYHQSIHTGNWKLIRSFFFRRDEEDPSRADYNNLAELFEDRPYRCQRVLFDLQRDPGETRDVFGTFPEMADRLEVALDAWWQEIQPRREEGARDMETELIRRLEALGYL